MRRKTSVLTMGLALSVLLAASAASAQPNPDRNAYFGETHVHTSWSLDAWTIGNTVNTPADAYKYFKGFPIKHPLGYDVKIDTPLDWAGVDGPLRVRRRHPGGKRARVRDQQGARRPSP